MRAMMLNVGMHPHQRTIFLLEDETTTIKLRNIVVQVDNKNSYKRFYNSQPDYIKNLRSFGEVGIVTEKARPTIKP
jgi:hypothetical protein